MAIRIALDLKLFDLVAPGPQTLDDLVQATQADAKLLRRLLRMLTAIGWLKQESVDKWGATPMSSAATIPAPRDWLIAHFDTRMETFTKFPEWLRKHNHKTSWLSDTNNIFMEQNNESAWEYMASHPEYGARFDSAMSMQDSFPPEMSPRWPFDEEGQHIKNKGDGVTLVDIGGGFGQTIESIKKAHPQLPGPFVLQDLPKSIDGLDPSRMSSIGFEAQAHDFFQPQPIKGAKYYLMRRVLHDWNDKKCLEILVATRSAMDASYSKLIIVDFVLPDLNAGLFETQTDLMMMTSCDGQERSELEWHELLEKAGFKIDRITKAEIGATAVIEASLA